MTDTDAKHLRDLTPHQWKSGIAAWLGWMFDGLDMHLYTLVAMPFVAALMGGLATSDPEVKEKSAWIMAAFLFGWALGGGFFGFIGDRLGRSKALMLTILTYSIFTGMSFFATSWWDLMIYRFLAALGIGGEWAVGASLLAETWPRTWRPWLAAILQTGVNVGVMLATLFGFLLSDFDHRYVFLVGLLPALITLWIRRAVPETEEWHEARKGVAVPGISQLFGREIIRTTLLTMGVCALGLSAHWAFMFWHLQHMRALPEVETWTAGESTRLATVALFVLMTGSIIGNFTAGALSRVIGYRLAIIGFFLVYSGLMMWCYSVPRTVAEMWPFLFFIGVCQGVFGLFTMYLPPLFPTLLRTTGAGFCYNIGRIASATTVVILVSKAPVFQDALFYAGMLFIPAAAIASFLPDRNDAKDA